MLKKMLTMREIPIPFQFCWVGITATSSWGNNIVNIMMMNRVMEVHSEGNDEDGDADDEDGEWL